MRRSRNYTYVGMTLVFGIVLLDLLVMAVVAGVRM
jgi:hypothetical protein